MKITFLGTGTSQGIPMIACKCSVCTSENSRNTRTRTSILISQEGKNILVDTSIDLRAQALSLDLFRLDVILLTHTHADHLLGLDEVRRYNQIQKQAIPLYADDLSLRNIRRTFYYIFEDSQEGGGKPKIELNRIGNEPFKLFDFWVLPLPVFHGNIPIKGFRIENFAYITDCSYIPDETMEKMNNLDILILGALKREKHATHFSLYESLEIVEKLKPGSAFFTHICHKMEHDFTNREISPHAELAYDGLVLETN